MSVAVLLCVTFAGVAGVAGVAGAVATGGEELR
jgi:hypothetical protein